MNTVSNTNSASNPINELIAKVMDKFDTNKDKQLNANEFSSFLSSLLGGSGAASLVGTTGQGTAAVEGEAAEFNPTPANFGQLHGFAATNYYDPNMKSMKYTFARIAADYDPSQPGALDRLVADPRFAAAFPNAKVVDRDQIDFGGQLSDGGNRGVPVGRVDVGEAFLDSKSGPAWQWLDLSNA